MNKYYPPDWDPSKGSVNKYVGQHPLRDRAKKLSQGILVIRYTSVRILSFLRSGMTQASSKGTV